MRLSYDMCVDYDAINELEDRLRNIDYDLDNSLNQMIKAVQISSEFLSGNQFQKACRATEASIEITQRTRSNIANAQNYLAQIREKIVEYEKCAYEGDS